MLAGDDRLLGHQAVAAGAVAGLALAGVQLASGRRVALDQAGLGAGRQRQRGQQRRQQQEKGAHAQVAAAAVPPRSSRRLNSLISWSRSAISEPPAISSRTFSRLISAFSK